ncbi:MAG: hypothetical protein NTW30_00705, partial [Candidatus Aenigmarchaeota archaeon]|nr:hypothetical protein [Candidatus Aenigmarchaeota archaeon]
CKPSNDKGIAEECNSTSLPEGTYYIMVNYGQEYSQGTGTYNLSVKCSPKSCSNPDDPCRIDCGKSKTDRSTNTQDYFTFRLSSDSKVTIKMFPSANVDYDLYVNWDETIPTIDHADCEPTVGTGLREECKMPNQDISTFLGEGDYYIMVDHYYGAGTYDLVLSCPSITTGTTTTTTTRITTSTSRSTTTTGITTTTTTEEITTTTTEASCGVDGYCIDENNQCTESYEPCSSNNGDCGDNEKCCCPKGNGPGYMMVIVGLLLTFVLIILVFFYFKGRSRMTYEKLYSKWSRILIEKPRI